MLDEWTMQRARRVRVCAVLAMHVPSLGIHTSWHLPCASIHSSSFSPGKTKPTRKGILVCLCICSPFPLILL